MVEIPTFLYKEISELISKLVSHGNGVLGIKSLNHRVAFLCFPI